MENLNRAGASWWLRKVSIFVSRVVIDGAVVELVNDVII